MRNKISWGSLILASKSPRRCDLLKSLGIPFKKISIDINETTLKHKTPTENARCLAIKKAKKAMLMFPEDLILAADTLLSFRQNVIGKPIDYRDAIRILTMLSGEEHDVITAIALFHKLNKLKEIGHVATRVSMKKLSKTEIVDYVKTGESLDKAGAYAIQGKGSFLIKSYKGCYNNVVGLPTTLLKKKLEILGF